MQYKRGDSLRHKIFMISSKI